LAQSGARVLYNTPDDKRKMVNDAVIGAGIDGVEHCKDIWQVKNEVDCFVFPDCSRQGEQAELRSQGKAVWGSGAAMRLELDRLFFLQKLEELGLDVPPYEVINGLTNLAVFLKDKEDIWIKVSEWRGSFESTHWRSWKQDANMIDTL